MFCISAQLKNWGDEQMEKWSAKREVDFTRPIKTKQEVMREYNKAYREKNNSYVACECGSVFKVISKYTHNGTARHQRWVAASLKTDAGSGKE
jgi:predicted secreted protein